MAFSDEMRAQFPSMGPDWDRAVDAGVDVSLLLRNLEMTPSERLKQMVAWLQQIEKLKQVVIPSRDTG